MEAAMNTKQTSAPESPALDRLQLSLGWWFPSGPDVAEELDQRLRTTRAFVTDCHTALQAGAGRLRETILAANERIARELTKAVISRQPVDLIAVQGEIGKVVFEATAANAAAWNDFWRTVCECTARSAQAPEPRTTTGAKAAREPSAPTGRQPAETGELHAGA